MSELKFCPQCGASLRDGARFCTSCGHKLDTPITPNQAAQILDKSSQEKDIDETRMQTNDSKSKVAVQRTHTDDLANKTLAPPPTPPLPLKSISPKDSKNKTQSNNSKPGNKKFWLWVILACVFVGVCGAGIYYYLSERGSSYYYDDWDDDDDSKNDKYARDSDATDKIDVEEVDAAVAIDSITEEYLSPEEIKYIKNFSSKDLTLCDMHGRVSFARLYEDGNEKEFYDFSINGDFTYSSNTHNPNNISRDDKGRVIRDGNVRYQWKNGLVSEEYRPGDVSKRYIYSSTGELRGIEYNDGYTSRTESYTNYEYDQFLNWVRRTRISPNGAHYTQTRSISYFR